LLGVLFTASVSGVLTRQSNKRLKQEGVDNNRRLRLDAAMRAGSLVAPSKDLPLSPASAASGLLALTELDHSELAVALLVDLWSKKTGVLEEQGAGPGRAVDPAEKMNASSRVSNETAVLVIDAALRSYSCPNAPLIAAELLCRNAELLDACQSLHWPSAIDGGWIPEVGPKTKLLLVDALVTMTVTSDANENALRSLAVRLYGIWEGDPDTNLKGCVGVLIKAIMPFVKGLNYTNFMHGTKSVTMAELQTAADSATPNPDDYLARMVEHRAQLLEKWAGGCSGNLSYRAGALADGLGNQAGRHTDNRSEASAYGEGVNVSRW
jgi:hypothetical protein